MGCVADKPINESRTLTSCKPATSNPFPVAPPKETLINYKLLEAIKKRDVILLKKTLQQFQIRPTELVGPLEQAKTILHKLAENNFSDGMALFLEELASQKSVHASRILNMRDADGNTPLLLCCLSDAVETLEVLLRNEHIDIEAKNFAKKSALEIAMEMESPCINVLTMASTTTKATIKSSSEGSQQLRSLEEASKGVQNDKEDDVSPNTRTSLDTRSYVFSSKDLQEGQGPKSAQEIPVDPSLRRLHQLINELKSKETSFVDPEFPHENCYLEDDEVSLLSKYPGVTWIRPSRFTPMGSKTVVYEHFDLGTVAKTPLIGCEIYSALAAMAEFPQRLSKIFTSKEVNKQGVYAINFTVAGAPIEILLDDFFPSTNGSQLMYSKPSGNELWFQLLEKAFAKLHDGYNGLETIGIMEALETLTGMPVAQRGLRDAEEDKLWAKLMDYDKRNYIVCAGVTRKYQNNYRNRIFTIVNIAEVNQHRIIKLRNHFNDFSWEGDFSYNSPLWTKEMRDEIGYCITDTSCFYMDIKDFIAEFEFLTVCHYHDGWTQNRLNVTSEPNHPTYFEFTIDKEIETYISVHQKSAKFVEEAHGYDVSPVEIILAKDMEELGLESIAYGEHDAFLGKPAVYIHESHKVKLQPGKYMIYAKVKWIDNKSHDFFLNILSSLPTKLTQVTPPAEFNFLEKVYLTAGSASKEKILFRNDCQFASGWSGSHLWMFVHNRSSKTLEFEITFDKMRSIKLGKKFRTELNVLKLVVPPNQKGVAYAKRTSPAAVSVGWELSQRWI